MIRPYEGGILYFKIKIGLQCTVKFNNPLYLENKGAEVCSKDLDAAILDPHSSTQIFVSAYLYFILVWGIIQIFVCSFKELIALQGYFGVAENSNSHCQNIHI